MDGGSELSENVSGLTEDFDRACSIVSTNPNESVSILHKIIQRKDLIGEDANLLKEKSIYELAEIYTKEKNHKAIQQLLVDIRPFFKMISKAKTGKIVRTLIDKLAAVEGATEIQIDLCEDCIKWCVELNRVFLKQQIETRLAQYYLNARRYQSAVKLITRLVREIKKVDDKHLLVEAHLIESRILHALHNIPKSKAALTASRAAANSIYIGPKLQAEIDMQAGSLSSEERDYKTSFSYFYEAFEGFDGLKDARAPQSLKYMLLSKIMNDQPQDITAIVAGKIALKYKSRDVDAMRAVAEAYKKRSLHAFEEVVNNEFRVEIQGDVVVRNKLQELSDKLLEQNLQRLLEPFEKVEIGHIAKLIDLPVPHVQRKLSQMILDKKFNGILDQGAGAIIVFDEQPEEKSYDHALSTVEVLNEALDKLFDKAKKLD